MKGAALLQVERVSFERSDDAGRAQGLLRDISLSVAAGEVLAIAGPSGGGKSTLLRLCNRLLEPSGGSILLDGEDIRQLSPPELRARVALVAQKPFLFTGSVADNLHTPARLRHTPLPDFTSAAVLETLELCQVEQAWLERDARKLSLGQQQRVCLARALCGGCEVLLLDEPTSALDRQNAERMARSLQRLAEVGSMAIVLVTHDLQLAAACADRVALLIDGVVVEQGVTEQLLQRPQSAAARAFLAVTPTTEDGEGR